MQKNKILLILFLLSCKTETYDIQIDTRSSDNSGMGHYLHGGVKISSGTYKFIFHNERTKVTDTTIVRIINN